MKWYPKEGIIRRTIFQFFWQRGNNEKKFIKFNYFFRTPRSLEKLPKPIMLPNFQFSIFQNKRKSTNLAIFTNMLILNGRKLIVHQSSLIITGNIIGYDYILYYCNKLVN